MTFEKLNVKQEDGVLFAEIAAPPMNLLGRELVLGRGRAMEVLLSADDYDAATAAEYGWINRALPAAALAGFVSSLAHRIARFPAAGHAVVKERINAITLAPVEDFSRDGDLFSEGVRNPEAQSRIQAAMKLGLQTHDGELALPAMLGL